MDGMGNRTIRQQLAGLSGLTVAILVVLAVVGLGATARLSAIFGEFRLTASETLAANTLSQELSEMRVHAMSYRLTHSDEMNATVHEEAETLLAHVGEYHAEFGHDAKFATLLELIEADARAYLAEFDGLVAQDIALRDLKGTLEEQELAAETALGASLQEAAMFGDSQSMTALTQLQREILRTNMGFERSVNEANAALFDEASSNLSSIQNRIAEIERKSDIASLTTVGEHLGAYAATAGEIRGAVEASIAHRATMDHLGPELAHEVAELVEIVAEHQNELGPKVDTTSRLTLVLIILVSAVAVAVSIFLSRKISSGISGSLKLAVDEMSQVAEGDLEIDISNTEAETEVGEMARALAVFRDKAVEARDLQEAKVREDERQREEEIRRAEAEKKAEAERQAKQAEERRAMITSLQEAVGSVVDAAAAGDFSERVNAQFDDKEFEQMAGSINLLLDNVEGGLNEIVRVMTTLSEGDLTDRINGEHSGVFASLQTHVNATIETLSDIVLEITAKCEAVGAQAARMADQSGSLADRAESQAASLEETLAAMEEMAASAKSSAQGASEAAQIATSSSQKVEEAGEVVVAAVNAMSDIKGASDRIGEIVSVIEGIAFQTNLLALNASVEAARAGSAGKGFAVVASEVRALAQRSSEASQDIKSLIEESAGQVDRGVDMVENTGKTLKEIVASVKSMADAMDKLTTAAREQSQGVSEVTVSISELDVITQKNAALADSSRESSGLLKTEAEAMRSIVGRFHTSKSGSGPALSATG